VPDNRFTYENPYLEPLRKKEKEKDKSPDEIKEYLDNIITNLKPHTNRISQKLKQQMTVLNEMGETVQSQSLRRNFSFQKNMSSYLNNLNDYQINEFSKYNEEKFLKFNRKTMEAYNPIIDQSNEMQLPKITIEKWTNFYEK